MKKILVIEDEPQVRANIKQILEFSDFEALTATDGADGLKMVNKHLPDLIICDIMMPELDGYSVITALRQDPKTATIPFIFLTAKVDRNDIRQGMNLGADDYLMKPFTPEELLDAVNTRLTKNELISESFQDQIKEYKSEADYYKFHDNLTGLPQEFVFKENFNYLAKEAAARQQLLPLWLIGIGQLDSLNSRFGPVIGNSLIKAVAERLSNDLFPENQHILAIISYLGGDRFAILGQPVADLNEINQIGQELIQTLAPSFKINNHDIFIRPSIGITFSQEAKENLDQLLIQAELALKEVQKKGGNNYQLYQGNMPLLSSRRMTIENDLSHVLERKELEVFYQPQIDLRNGKIVGLEALIRWRHPQLGLISPGEFLNLAETNGFINIIDQWVLNNACHQLATWQQQGISGLKMSVNILPSDFFQPDFCEIVQHILTVTGMEPHCLELEFTETELINNLQQANQIMSELKLLGVQLALDDFGTGYSSFSYLANLPFDTLKIDRSFIRNIHHSPNNLALIKGMIKIAQDLQLNIVAEGIETPQELTLLQREKCQFGQGYLFSHPLTASEFKTLFDFVSSISLNSAHGYKSFWTTYDQEQKNKQLTT
jgi:diguanylate cyclase